MAIIKKLLTWKDPVFSGLVLGALNCMFIVTWWYNSSLVYLAASTLFVAILGLILAQRYLGVDISLDGALTSAMEEEHMKEFYTELYTKINCSIDCLRSVVMVKCKAKTTGVVIGFFLFASLTSWLSHFMCFWLLTNFAFVAHFIKIQEQHKKQAKDVWEKVNAQIEELLTKVPSYHQLEREGKYKVDESKKEDVKLESKNEDSKEEPKKDK